MITKNTLKTNNDDLRIVIAFLRKQMAVKMEEVNQIAKQICEAYEQLQSIPTPNKKGIK